MVDTATPNDSLMEKANSALQDLIQSAQEYVSNNSGKRLDEEAVSKEETEIQLRLALEALKAYLKLNVNDQNNSSLSDLIDKVFASTGNNSDQSEQLQAALDDLQKNNKNMDDQSDAYAVLNQNGGLPNGRDSTQAEITKAYRDLTFKNQQDSDNQEEADKQQQQFNDAYNQLNTKDKQSEYNDKNKEAGSYSNNESKSTMSSSPSPSMQQ